MYTIVWDELQYTSFPEGTKVSVSDKYNQIYVVKGGRWVPEITWTNCAGKMPPDNDTKVILKISGGIYQAFSMDLWNKRDLYGLKERVIQWTEFTDEKWKYLNDPSNSNPT